MIELTNVFWEKAEENLAAAQSEFVNGRYNSSSNRSYYACFQAAVYALARAGIQPRGPRDEWGHDALQAAFNGELISRMKTYPASLRGALNQNYTIRQIADYSGDHVTEIRAARTVARAEQFLQAVRPRESEQA